MGDDVAPSQASPWTGQNAASASPSPPGAQPAPPKQTLAQLIADEELPVAQGQAQPQDQGGGAPMDLARICTGQARILAGNPRTIGRGVGGFQVPVRAETAAIIPDQFGGRPAARQWREQITAASGRQPLFNDAPRYSTDWDNRGRCLDHQVLGRCASASQWGGGAGLLPTRHARGAGGRYGRPKPGDPAHVASYRLSIRAEPSTVWQGRLSEPPPTREPRWYQNAEAPCG